MGCLGLRRAALGLWVVALMGAGPMHAAAPVASQVVATVAETDGSERKNWPLTFGVPWPPGRLREASIAIHDAGGTALPVQTRVLSKWPDGSVRWVLADTQVTLAAHESKRLTIARAAAQPAVNKGLQVHERDDRIDIDTGALRFSIPKRRFAIAERVTPAGGKETGPVTAVLQRENTPLLASTPRSVTILDRGPLRVRVELAGTYGDGFDYIIRIEAYAGQPLLRVLHTFLNLDPADSVSVPRITIDWSLPPSMSSAYSVGVENSAAQSGEVASDGARFVQVDNEIWRFGDEERPGKLSGWFTLGGGAQTVGVSARWFWQQYPQSVLLAPHRIAYNLWAPEVAPAQVGMGAAKTHELVLWAGNSVKHAAPSIAQPLVAAVDSAWIARSGALPQAITASLYNEGFLKDLGRAFDRYMQRNATERWDDSGSVNCDGLFGERPRTGAYGMWNWGDWNFPRYHDETKGCDAWGNLEYDTTQVLALGFAATGDAQMSDAMAVAARHFMDVDTVHFQRRHPEWVGMNHPKNPLHFSFELGGIDLGHTWTEGLLSYYYFTGDERGLLAARGIADYLVRRSKGILALANPRQLGWPQIALLAVYAATNEREYLDAARVYARRSLELFKAEKINHWKHGVLADALAYLHEATRDAEVEQWLRTYARVIGSRRQAEPRFIPGIAYVARLSTDPELRAFALAGVQHIDLGGWGKPFTLAGRLGFRVYSLLAEPEAMTGATEAKPTAVPAKRRPQRGSSKKKAR